MRFTVTIHDFGASPSFVARHVGLTLTQARAKATRAARQGLNLHGAGAVHRHPWGADGGRFPMAYRSATIGPDHGDRSPLDVSEAQDIARQRRVSAYMQARNA